MGGQSHRRGLSQGLGVEEGGVRRRRIVEAEVEEAIGTATRIAIVTGRGAIRRVAARRQGEGGARVTRVGVGAGRRRDVGSLARRLEEVERLVGGGDGVRVIRATVAAAAARTGARAETEGEGGGEM